MSLRKLAVLNKILDAEEDLFLQKKRLKGARFREEADKADAEQEMSVLPSGRVVEVLKRRLAEGHHSRARVADADTGVVVHHARGSDCGGRGRLARQVGTGERRVVDVPRLPSRLTERGTVRAPALHLAFSVC